MISSEITSPEPVAKQPVKPTYTGSILNDMRVVRDPGTAYTMYSQMYNTPDIEMKWHEQAAIAMKQPFFGDNWGASALESIGSDQLRYNVSKFFGQGGVPLDPDKDPDNKVISFADANKKYPMAEPWREPVREGWAKRVSENEAMSRAINQALADTNFAQDVLHLALGLPMSIAADPVAFGALTIGNYAIAAGAALGVGGGTLAKNAITKGLQTFAKVEAGAAAAKSVGLMENVVANTAKTRAFFHETSHWAKHAAKETAVNMGVTAMYGATGISDQIADLNNHTLTKEGFMQQLYMDGAIGALFGSLSGVGIARAYNMRTAAENLKQHLQAADAGKVSMGAFVGPKNKIHNQIFGNSEVLMLPAPEGVWGDNFQLMGEPYDYKYDYVRDESYQKLLPAPEGWGETFQMIDRPYGEVKPEDFVGPIHKDYYGPTTPDGMKPEAQKLLMPPHDVGEGFTVKEGDPYANGPIVLDPIGKQAYHTISGPWYSGIDDPKYIDVKRGDLGIAGPSKTYGSGMYLTTNKNPSKSGSLFYGDIPPYMGEFHVTPGTKLLDIRRAPTPDMVVEAARLLKEEFGFTAKESVALLKDVKTMQGLLDQFSFLTIHDTVNLENAKFIDRLNAKMKDKFGYDGYYWETVDKTTAPDGKEIKAPFNNIQLFAHENGILTDATQLIDDSKVGATPQFDPEIQKRYEAFLKTPESNIGYDPRIGELHDRIGKEGVMPEKFKYEQVKAETTKVLEDMNAKVKFNEDVQFQERLKEEVARAKKRIDTSDKVFKELADCTSVRGE